MHRTRIKFCGITSPADALRAAEAGADAIGLIFYAGSPRCVSVELASEIIAALPPMVCPIGLFVNSPLDEILRIARQLNLHTVQLHGDELPELIGQLAGLAVIKAIRCEPRLLGNALQIWSRQSRSGRPGGALLDNQKEVPLRGDRYATLSGILLETAGTSQPGGTGIENDWAAIATAIADRTDLPPIIAAGGLTPENVASVIHRLRPWAVDVSSGIEETPGIKSSDKMRRFAINVRQADASM